MNVRTTRICVQKKGKRQRGWAETQRFRQKKTNTKKALVHFRARRERAKGKCDETLERESGMSTSSETKARGAVIITGGSRGIGAAIARLAGARGYGVALSFVRDAAAAESVVQDIFRGGGRAVAVQADVVQERDILF